MAYRSKPSGFGAGAGRDLVTVRSYLDVIEAELARGRLQSSDIFAVVVEPTAFNPMLTGAAGGIALRVRGEDLERAEDILADVAIQTADQDDGEGEDVVRCPRCELAYCSYGRAPLHGSALNLVVLAAWLVAFAGPKRWHCERCEHVWDDPKAGPKRMTLLDRDAPRPVFRLRRGRAGTGMFVGLIVAVFGALATAQLASPASMLFLAAPVLGWLVGREIREDVCSEPSCRAPLAARAETCARCKGTIAGVIASAAEHYAMAAELRREIAALDRPRRVDRKARPRAQDAAVAD